MISIIFLARFATVGGVCEPTQLFTKAIATLKLDHMFYILTDTTTRLPGCFYRN